MVDLKNVLLMAIGSTHTKETEKALEICQSECVFKDVVFFTDDETVKYQHAINPLKSIKEYDYFVLKELPQLITGKAEYYLTVHWDGFIVNSRAWTKEFFKYDYIGAVWPWFNYICGNGGFCLKSQKFIETQLQILDKLDITKPDDVALCITARKLFVEKGCLFAPAEIAFKFSIESDRYDKYNSFGFHDFKYHPQFKKLIS
jgi:hypothetical protein